MRPFLKPSQLGLLSTLARDRHYRPSTAQVVFVVDHHNNIGRLIPLKVSGWECPGFRFVLLVPQGTAQT